MAQTSTWQIGPAPTGLAMRQGVNAQVAALQSSNSGPVAPTVTVAGMLWFDTSTTPGVLKQRNVTDDGWVSVPSLVSPNFTGDPTVPTQSAGNNSTKVANTAFVSGELINYPHADGLVSAAKAMDTVYLNTSGRTKLVYLTLLQTGAANFAILSMGTTNPPSPIVGGTYAGASGYGGFFFAWPKNHYFRIQNAGGGAGAWTIPYAYEAT